MKSVLLSLAAAAALACCVSCSRAGDQARPEMAQAPAHAVKDPVCGMTVDPKDAAAKADYKGKTYYFCSREDKERFEKSPDKYVAANAR